MDLEEDKTGTGKPFRQSLLFSGPEEKRALTRIMATGVEKRGKGV